MKKSNSCMKINRFTLIAVAFLFGVIIAKLIYVAVAPKVDGIDLKTFALSRTTANKVIKAKRGTIYDINNEVLAQDARSYTLIAYLAKSRTTNPDYPQHVIDKVKTAKELATVINASEEYILKRLNQDAYQVEFGTSGKGLTELQKQKIESLDLPGIDFIKSTNYKFEGTITDEISGISQATATLYKVTGVGSSAAETKVGETEHLSLDAYGNWAFQVYELDAFRTLAGAYENSRRYQKENVQVIEKAQANITAKIEAEAAAERAKKGFWDAVAAIGTMAIGAAAIICTGGAATPLVVAAGVSAMAYGASNLVEAGHDIYYGLNGDAATRAFNPVRDTLFMGNQTAYDIWGSASTAMSLGFAFAGAGAQASVAAGEANPLTISSMVGSVKTGATTFFKSGLVNMTKTGATAAAKTAVVGGNGAVVEKIVTPYTSEDFGRLSGILAASLTARKLYSGNNSSNAKKEINTGDQKVIEVRDAKTANQEWLDRGYDKPPYDPSYETRIVEAGNEHYVRTYTYNEDGTSNKLGGWLMREKDVAGLSSAEIADKYALPKTPTHICDVKVDSKAHLNAGIANSVEGWGTGGGLQYDTMGKRLPASNFTNERLIGK